VVTKAHDDAATPASPTEPLRAEHRELLPHIEALAKAGDAIGAASLEEQRRQVDAAHRFLVEHLIPHATAEDRVLYVEVDRLIGERGGTHATDTMRRDHAEVGRLVDELGEVRRNLGERELDEAEQREARRLLYGLHTLIRVHFAKEEEVYLPLLDRELSADRAQALFAEMGRVAHSH
jgi:iron-sulfur cluster repair protein YtfE (RIC family)